MCPMAATRSTAARYTTLARPGTLPTGRAGCGVAAASEAAASETGRDGSQNGGGNSCRKGLCDDVCGTPRAVDSAARGASHTACSTCAQRGRAAAAGGAGGWDHDGFTWKLGWWYAPDTCDHHLLRLPATPPGDRRADGQDSAHFGT